LTQRKDFADFVSIAYNYEREEQPMAQFPDTPSFTGFNAPSRIECDIPNLAHEGVIPPELNGAFFRVQPDAQFPPRLGDDISFNAGRRRTSGSWRTPPTRVCSVPIAIR
jgi:hypothetical protein